MSQPRCEWGPGFLGYSRDWFLSGWHLKLDHNFYFSGYDSYRSAWLAMSIVTIRLGLWVMSQLGLQRFWWIEWVKLSPLIIAICWWMMSQPTWPWLQYYADWAEWGIRTSSWDIETNQHFPSVPCFSGYACNDMSSNERGEWLVIHVELLFVIVWWFLYRLVSGQDIVCCLWAVSVWEIGMWWQVISLILCIKLWPLLYFVLLWGTVSLFQLSKRESNGDGVKGSSLSREV